VTDTALSARGSRSGRWIDLLPQASEGRPDETASYPNLESDCIRGNLGLPRTFRQDCRTPGNL